MHEPHSHDPGLAIHATTPAGPLRVSLFAGMAAAIGRRSLQLDWEGGTAAALRSRLADEFPALAPLLARSAVAIGDAYVTDHAVVPHGVDVAIIPPVSGG